MNTLTGELVQGYRVASGLGGDPRFPEGTLGPQLPLFGQLGLDLSAVYKGTLNVNTKPFELRPIRADHTFEQLTWLEGYPAETFSFVALEIEYRQESIDGWFYYPHPETKPEHEQPAGLAEILAPYIPDIRYGDKLTLHYDATKLEARHIV